jgi:O-antigen biosynthesis protein WbqP
MPQVSFQVSPPQGKASRAYCIAKRCFDLAMVLLGLPFAALPMLAIAAGVRLTSHGPALHWSKRVGRYNQIFLMPKFRTMTLGAPQLATHLMTNPEAHVTRFGSWLRRKSLDELPQLFSVLKGDLSLVGPRPALFNQDDLVALRTARGVHELIPGLTGWAQINGRDDLPIPVKVEFDHEYLVRRSFGFDLKILFRTFFHVARGEGVQH